MMEQNTNQEQQTPAPKKGMSNFKIVALLAALSWILFPIGLVASIICAIYLHVKGRYKESRAIWAGLGIGLAIIVIVFGVTCFTLMNINP
jgi:hypothetical protein